VTLLVRSLREFLVVIGPLYSIAIFLYFLVEGSGSACSGSGASFHCWEITYASKWGLSGSLIVGAVMVLTLAPALSARLRRRMPSIVSAVVIGLLIALDIAQAWPWVPAWAAVLAAAVAGPPLTFSRATDDTPTSRS
jgi:xanthine/uracil permease